MPLAQEESFRPVSKPWEYSLLTIRCWVRWCDSQADLKGMAQEGKRAVTCVIKTRVTLRLFKATVVKVLGFLLILYFTEMLQWNKLWRARAAVCDISFHFWIAGEMNVWGPQPMHFHSHSSRKWNIMYSKLILYGLISFCPTSQSET